MTIGSPRTAIPFTLLLASGCLIGPQPGKSGELGNDRFVYACVADTDGMCDDLAGTFDKEPIYGLPVVALGSKFGLDTDGITTEARSINDWLQETSTTSSGTRGFVAKKAGWTAVGSFTYDDQPVDLVHMLIVEPTSSKLFQRTTSSAQWSDAPANGNLVGDDHLELRVTPADSQGQLLAGGLDVTWTAVPLGIVTLSPDQGDNVATVHAVANGDVTVTAKLGDFTNTIALTVSGEGGAGGGGGGGGGGAGGAGGAGGHGGAGGGG